LQAAAQTATPDRAEGTVGLSTVSCERQPQ
jgi:hypothetical protein